MTRNRRTIPRASNLLPLVFAIGVALGFAGNAKAHSGSVDLDCEEWKVEDGSPQGHSRHLGCTGLYEHWGLQTISHEVRSYLPARGLWSDGAEKRRWILLPAGTQIDTGGPGGRGSLDGWIFPVGTKVWKEFRFGDRRVETRFMWKRAGNDWFRAVYVWTEDQSAAIEYPVPVGFPLIGEATAPAPYEIPAPGQCTSCHAGSSDMLLGFEAVTLGEAAAPGITLDELVAAGRLTAPPAGPVGVPGTGVEREAIGWLHTNCGLACHNAQRMPAPAQLRMRVASDDASVADTDVWNTAVRADSWYQPPGDPLGLTNAGGDWKRITPGHADTSTIVFRAGVRDVYPGPYDDQMPPLVTHRVDEDAMATLRAWIDGL